MDHATGDLAADAQTVTARRRGSGGQKSRTRTPRRPAAPKEPTYGDRHVDLVRAELDAAREQAARRDQLVKAFAAWTTAVETSRQAAAARSAHEATMMPNDVELASVLRSLNAVVATTNEEDRVDA